MNFDETFSDYCGYVKDSTVPVDILMIDNKINDLPTTDLTA